MKLLLLRSSNQWLNHAISKACCCSRTLSTATPYSPFDNLRTRISHAGNPNGSIVMVLDQWLDEGKPIKQSDLHFFIKMLRKYRRHTHALQIRVEEAEEEILSLIKNSDFSPSGYIVRTSNGEKLGSGESGEFSELDDERIDVDTDDYMEVK